MQIIHQKGETMENDKKEKAHKKRKTGSFIWLMSVCFIAVGLLLFCQFYFGDTINSSTTFYEGTKINGVDVSGLKKSEAQDLLQTTFINQKDNINLTLSANGKDYVIDGKNLEFVGNFDGNLDRVLAYGHEGNIFEKQKVKSQIAKDGLDIYIPYEDMLGNLDDKVEEVLSQVEALPTSTFISFDPNSEQMFTLNEGGKGYVANRDELKKSIAQALATGQSKVEIPLQEVLPKEDLSSLLNQISLRSKFSTNYAKSTQSRKSNIKRALSAFNGMIVEPGQRVSFNEVTGPRTASNGYKDGKVIIDGSYVSGMGGGVCQASTTLYNALLLGDITVTKSFHHSLPASYVPLSFDAMVSEGYADLEFVNNQDTPIYIKAYGTDEEAIVEIYGAPLEDGLEIKIRSELVKVLPHEGDTIIKDRLGEYSNKVLYEGEYYRLKYPHEGYETRGYLQYYRNGELVEEKEVRHDSYKPQKGVIVEGVWALEEGMELPENGVKYISPQKITQSVIDNAKKRSELVQSGR